MAIQVNGTTVIDNSRVLSNVTGLKTINGTSILWSGDIAAGGAPVWNPASTPDVTITSTSTWTKPTLADDTYIFVYMVGGGGGSLVSTSTWQKGGSGAGAAIFSGLSQEFPSSIAFTVGSGGSANYGAGAGGNGGNTTCTVDTVVYTATGGFGGTNDSNAKAGGGGSFAGTYSGRSPFVMYPNTSPGTTTDNYSVYPQAGGVGSFSSTPNVLFGGAGGVGAVNGSGTTYSPGTSLYAGDGGHNNTTGSNFKNGGVPGGGGGATPGGLGGTGGAGNVRIWYLV